MHILYSSSVLATGLLGVSKQTPFLFYCITRVRKGACTHVEAREQLLSISSLLLEPIWEQASLCAEPSHWPNKLPLLISKYTDVSLPGKTVNHSLDALSRHASASRVLGFQVCANT